MARSYGYLTVRTRGCDLVCFADGTTRIVDPGDGAKIVQSWQPNGEPIEEAVAESLRHQTHAYHHELAQWESGLRARFRSNETRLTPLPEAAIREPYEREHPRLTPPEPLEAQRPTVEPAQWWFATCPRANVDMPLEDSTQALPRTAIAEVLTNLARDGWSVVHIAEDRVVQHESGMSRAVVVGTSILLERDA